MTLDGEREVWGYKVKSWRILYFIYALELDFTLWSVGIQPKF